MMLWEFLDWLIGFVDWLFSLFTSMGTWLLAHWIVIMAILILIIVIGALLVFWPLILLIVSPFILLWVYRRKILATLVVVLAALVLMRVFIGVSIWFWEILVGYISPESAGDRKDVVQTYALIVAGIVGVIGGIVSIATLQTSRRTLYQQGLHESQRAEEDALQSYLKQMGDLLIDHDLKNTTREDIRQLAQAQTLTVVEQLSGGRRKGVLVRFLHGAGLIDRHETVIPLIDQNLSGAILYGADLKNANLSDTNLRGTNFSNGTDLRNANLSGTDLYEADLSGADLRNANLSGAHLYEADLRNANLSGADLLAADFGYAQLNSASVTKEQLAACKSLSGAKMPDWAISGLGPRPNYEKWLKTSEGHDWLRKYKKNLDEEKKREGEYDIWKRSPEFAAWQAAVREDKENNSS